MLEPTLVLPKCSMKIMDDSQMDVGNTYVLIKIKTITFPMVLHLHP